MGKGTTDTKEETSANGATKRNELDMAALEASRDIAVLFSGLDIAKDVGSLVDFGAATSLDRWRSVILKARVVARTRVREWAWAYLGLFFSRDLIWVRRLAARTANTVFDVVFGGHGDGMVLESEDEVDGRGRLMAGARAGGTLCTVAVAGLREQGRWL